MIPLRILSEDHPDSTPVAPLDDMEMELTEEDPEPVVDDANMPDSSTLPLPSVGDQQQTLGTGPPMAPYRILHPESCFGRPGWVGVSHSNWYHKTHHSRYWHFYIRLSDCHKLFYK